MKIASSQRRTSAEVGATNSIPSDCEKGQRKIKFSPPSVNSVKWRDIDQSFLTDLAASKVGKDKVCSLSTDAVNKVAFGCYSVDELCYVLQDIGFSEAPFPRKKKQLIKTIRSMCLDESDLIHTATDNKDVKLSRSSQGGLPKSCEVSATNFTGSSSSSDSGYASERNLPTPASSSSVHHKSSVCEVTAVTHRGFEDAEDSEFTFVTECNSRLPDRLVSFTFFFSFSFRFRIASFWSNMNFSALDSNLFIIYPICS